MGNEMQPYEYELDFVRTQEVGVRQVVPKNERTVNKRDQKFMAKAAKEERKRGKS